ncbi:zinc finger protein 397-like [Cherax quadricarinatus]|uniref:zinc finger protein 397-like n=1 Tax=Cherax quadricarinatus TaxID=27406 RepID=UPI00387E940D
MSMLNVHAPLAEAASIQHSQRLQLQTTAAGDTGKHPPEEGAQPDHKTFQHVVKQETSITGGADTLEALYGAPSSSDIQDIKDILSSSLNKHCPACSFVFRNLVSLKNHFTKTHFNLKILKCVCCNVEMSANLETYLNHCKIHNQQDSVPTSSLGSSTAKTRECRVCRKQVRSSVYSRHLAIHKKVPCPECKTLIVPHSLKRHINDCHTREISYPCPDCPAVYHDASNLLSHRKRNHLGQEARRHLCEVCGKKFITPSDLRTHVTGVHHNVKKFVCEFCGLSFKISSVLMYHRRLHTGERPHVCHVCGRTFMKPNGLAKHVRRVHRVEYHGKYRKRLHIAEPLSRNSLNQTSHSTTQPKREEALDTVQIQQTLDNQCGLTEDMIPSVDKAASHGSEGEDMRITSVYSIREREVVQMTTPVVVNVTGSQNVHSASYFRANIEDRTLPRSYDASQPLHTIAYFRESSDEQYTVAELLPPQEPHESRLEPVQRAYITPTHSRNHTQHQEL